MPGSLKNAIDWASRPTFGGPNAWKDKAVGIAGIGPQAYEGAHGGLLAAMALRQMYVEWRLIEHPRLHIARAPDRFTDSGELKQDVFTPFLSVCADNVLGNVCVADDPRYNSRSDLCCEPFLKRMFLGKLDSWDICIEIHFRSSSS